MATTPVTAAPKVSFLQHIGNFFKDIFKIGVEAATVAEPIVAVAFPQISVLFNSTVQAISNAEIAATAAGAQTGTGAQKLAMVTAAIEPIAIQYLQTQGISANSAQVTAWVNAIVAALNAFPAPTTPAA